jgi:hypothetical protein
MYTAVFDGWLLEANIFIWAKKKQSHNISSQKPFTAALLCGHHHRSPFQGKKSANRPDASGAGKKGTEPIKGSYNGALDLLPL